MQSEDKLFRNRLIRNKQHVLQIFSSVLSRGGTNFLGTRVQICIGAKMFRDAGHVQ